MILWYIISEVFALCISILAGLSCYKNECDSVVVSILSSIICFLFLQIICFAGAYMVT